MPLMPVSTGSAITGDGNQSDTVRPARRRRRRIPRACDDCRRKKIKCDGKRPCSSCAEFDSKCKYSGPDVRTNDLDTLRRRLQTAESLLQRYLPDLDLDNPDQRAPSPRPERRPPQSAGVDDAADGARFIPLVGSADQLDLTESGEYQFHGLSSGAAFLSRIHQHFPGLLRDDSQMPFLPRPSRPFPAKPLELPVYSAHPWRQVNHDYSQLPPRDLARTLSEYALSRGACLLRAIHAPSFWAMFEMLYDERPKSDANQQRRFTGLLFAVMALGSMYDVDENDPTNPDHYAVAIERGYKYYTSARIYLQDITECSDITTLQAMIFLIQFLQATGNLNGCHTFIGIALRSALRMGLHRHLPHIPMSPIKDETRRRVFYTIRQMDIYLSTTLGLPIMLEEGNIDQPWPTEVDDEYITEKGIQSLPPGTPSFLEAFNAHLKLMRILARVVEHLYPPRGMERGVADVTYMISYARVREIEQALKDWHEQLSESWRPGPEENTEITRVKILLRFAYAHVQLMLYRPFLQYYSRRASTDETADERYFALATAGINVCRNIIYIGLEIRRQAVLIGPYWFITNTQFFAILTLVLYVLYNPEKAGVAELFADARLGKECISGLTQRSLAADRVTAALNSFFDQLPSQLRSTDARGATANSESLPDVGSSRLRYQTNQGSRPHTQPGEQNAQGQRSFLTRGTSPQSSNSAVFYHEPATQTSALSSRTAQFDGPEPLMETPVDDPFAYLLLPGANLTNNDFSTFEEDLLRLPLFNLPTDTDGQLLQFQDPLHAPMLPCVPVDSSGSSGMVPPTASNPGGLENREAWEALGYPWGYVA